jgi:electron transfer flavoprotein alpha/beta subunit
MPSAVSPDGAGWTGTVRVERSLEDEIEVLDVPLPAVLSVTTDINQARLPTMKEILKASKKPVTELSLDSLGLADKLQKQDRYGQYASPQAGAAQRRCAFWHTSRDGPGAGRWTEKKKGS